MRNFAKLRKITDTDTHRLCIDCCQILPVDKFYTHKDGYYSSKCKKCEHLKYRETHPIKCRPKKGKKGLSLKSIVFRVRKKRNLSKKQRERNAKILNRISKRVLRNCKSRQKELIKKFKDDYTKILTKNINGKRREYRRIFGSKEARDFHTQIYKQYQQFCSENKELVRQKAIERKKIRARGTDEEMYIRKAFRDLANKKRSDRTKREREVWRTFKRRMSGKGGYKKPKKNFIEILMNQQKSLCNGCGEKLPENYHVDHIFPISKGGDNNIKNLQLLCPECNVDKSDKYPWEWVSKKMLK